MSLFQTSSFAQEGTDCHELCAYLVEKAILEAFDGIYDIDRVTMTIFQPRRDNISTWSCTKEELLKWADEVLAPTAALAYEGKGEFKAGEHCQFCKVKATCRKRA